MKLRAFLIGFGYFTFFFLGAALSRQVAHAQEECYSPDTGGDVDCCSFLSLCDCDPNEFDTCYIEPLPPPPPDWTENCLKTEPHAQLWGYADADIDSDGNLEAWTMAYNLDGVAGQVMPTAWLEVTMPDGTVVPEVLQGTWASPMISVSVDQPFTSYNDTGAGQLYGVSELHYNCGFNLSMVSNFRLGLHRATYEAEPQGTSCQFTLTCPSGTTAVCGTSSYNSGNGNPCQGTWLNLLFLGVTYTSGSTKLQCVGISPNVWATAQGTCD